MTPTIANENVTAGFRAATLLGCPWCSGRPKLSTMRYRNTGRLFGYKIHCPVCNFEKTMCPAGWEMGTEAEAMENAQKALIHWWNNRVQPNNALCDGGPKSVEFK